MSPQGKEKPLPEGRDHSPRCQVRKCRDLRWQKETAHLVPEASVGAAHVSLQLWPCWGEQLRKGQDHRP